MLSTVPLADANPAVPGLHEEAEDPASVYEDVKKQCPSTTEIVTIRCQNPNVALVQLLR